MESFEEFVRVEAGSPSPEELAAVVAVLSAAVAEANEQAAKAVSQPTSSWNRSSTMLRGQITPGPRQWNASFRPGLD